MTTDPAPRSQASRERILQAARTLFASQGYEATTLRQVAALAGTNLALVIRYYESKESLFARAADFNLRLPDLGELDRGLLGERLVSHFLQMWEGEESGRELVALLRAASSHAAARERMQRIFHEQLEAALCTLGIDPQEASMRAGLVASQMLGLALVRHVLALPAAAPSREATVRIVGETIQRYLSAAL